VVPVSDSRRSPRLRLRVPAVISFAGASHDVIAEDVGAEGCRIASPFPFRRGQALYLEVFLPAPAKKIAVAATVAWSSPAPPYRIGLSFARAGAEERARRVRALLERDPALARAPGPLRPGRRLRLGPAPRPGLVLGRDELTVLRAARDGTTVSALLEAAGDRFREVRSALATLRVRGLVHEGSAAGAASGWLALIGLDPFAPPPAPEPVVDPFSAPVRPLRALCFLEVARDEGANGHLGAAVEWLQAALGAAPDDAEIALALETLTVGSARGDRGDAPPPPQG